MAKVIIETLDDTPIADAVRYAQHVIEQGRISNEGKNYCYVTTWKDGTIVYTDRNKASDRFRVMREDR